MTIKVKYIQLSLPVLLVFLATTLKGQKYIVNQGKEKEFLLKIFLSSFLLILALAIIAGIRGGRL